MGIPAFARVVASERALAGLKIRDMATWLGVSVSYVSAMETGRRRLTTRFVDETIQFFRERGVKTRGLRRASWADMAEVQVAGLSAEQRVLVHALAYCIASGEYADAVESLITDIRKNIVVKQEPAQ